MHMFSRTVGLSWRTLATCPRQFSTTSLRCAGHSKWSKIKDRKGASDTHKSLLFGTARRDIIVAARTGGSPDPDKNAQLATVVKKYKEQGVPKDNIERALAKAREGKEKGGGVVVYEALAFGSVGVIATHLAPVKFMFERKGFVQVSLDKNLENFDKSVEELIEAALGADAEDFDQQPDEENSENVSLKFTSAPEALSKVCEAVMSMSSSMQSLRLQTNELIYKPVEANESTEELELQVSDLVSDLEGDEDILRVWTSLDSR